MTTNTSWRAVSSGLFQTCSTPIFKDTLANWEVLWFSSSLFLPNAVRIATLLLRWGPELSFLGIVTMWTDQNKKDTALRRKNTRQHVEQLSTSLWVCHMFYLCARRLTATDENNSSPYPAALRSLVHKGMLNSILLFLLNACSTPCNVGIAMPYITHFWWLIPPIYLWWWMGDGLWHCYTNIISFRKSHWQQGKAAEAAKAGST